jgi:hypothetical protein
VVRMFGGAIDLIGQKEESAREVSAQLADPI